MAEGDNTIIFPYPRDIWKEIASYLKPYGRFLFSLVSRTLRSIALEFVTPITSFPSLLQKIRNGDLLSLIGNNANGSIKLFCFLEERGIRISWEKVLLGGAGQDDEEKVKYALTKSLTPGNIEKALSLALDIGSNRLVKLLVDSQT